MNAKSDDPFFKMFVTPQKCDFCMTPNTEINRVILHAVYGFEEDTGKMKPIKYLPAKKCKKCCEEEND